MYGNEPGVLKLNDCKCTYNVYDNKYKVIEPKFITPPFVSYLPIIPKSYVVVDANHRISDNINEKKYKIQASLIRPEYTPIFLISSAEMAAFFFLKDICNIIYENNSQISNIKENLSIYAKPSVIDTLKSRTRMN